MNLKKMSKTELHFIKTVLIHLYYDEAGSQNTLISINTLSLYII
jgi:hypothetical protein